MRIAVVIAIAAALAGCAGPSASGPASSMPTASPSPAGPASGGPTGGQGGKIPNGVANMSQAMVTAQADCSNYGKKAFILAMAPPSEGGMLTYGCR